MTISLEERAAVYRQRKQTEEKQPAAVEAPAETEQRPKISLEERAALYRKNKQKKEEAVDQIGTIRPKQGMSPVFPTKALPEPAKRPEATEAAPEEKKAPRPYTSEEENRHAQSKELFKNYFKGLLDLKAESLQPGHPARETLLSTIKKVSDLAPNHKNEADKLYKMSKEEYNSLPFEKRHEADLKIAQAAKMQKEMAFARGAIPGFEPLQKVAEQKGWVPKTQLAKPGQSAVEFAGEMIPISIAGETVAAPLMNVLGKWKYVRPLSRMLGWGSAGATYEGVKKLANEGELPTPAEVGMNFALWGGLEGSLAALGWTGRMLKATGLLAKAHNVSRYKAFKGVVELAKQEGVPIQDIAQQTNAEARKKLATEFLTFAEKQAKAAETARSPAGKVSEKVKGVAPETIGRAGERPERPPIDQERVLKEEKFVKPTFLPGEPSPWMKKSDIQKSFLYDHLPPDIHNSKGNVNQKAIRRVLKENRDITLLSRDQKVLNRREWEKFFPKELYDKVYSDKLNLLDDEQYVGTIGDLIESPELRKYFKDVLHIPVHTMSTMGDLENRYMGGAFRRHKIDSSKNHIVLSKHVSPSSFFTSLVHEAKHAVQQLHGKLPPGPFPKDFMKYLRQPHEQNARMFERWVTRDISKHRQEIVSTKKAGKEAFGNKEAFPSKSEAHVTEAEATVHPDTGEPVKEKRTPAASVKPTLLDRFRNVLGWKSSELNERAWNVVRDFLGEKWARQYRSHLEWLVDFREKFPNTKERSDMKHYRENPEAIGKKKTDKGTGNPKVHPDDTYAAMEARMSPEAKKFVDEELDKHFAKMLKEFNASPYTKDINPRDFLEHIYIPHFYDGDPRRAAQMFSKTFKTSNPLGNMRKFHSFNDALRVAGLKPKFDDIAELMTAYDDLMVRMRVNSEIAAEIRKIETQTGKKLIVRGGSKNYDQCKAEGWIAFDDPYLKRKWAGTDKKTGKPIFTMTQAPALVNPEVASALGGVFVREFKKYPTGQLGKLWQGTKSIALGLDNFVKRFRLQFSPFHYWSLLESYWGAKGTPKIIKSLFRADKNGFRGIGKLMRDPGFMDELMRAGLNVSPPTADIGFDYSQLPMQKFLRNLELKGGIYKAFAKVVKTAGSPFSKMSNYLFSTFQPRMKVGAFVAYRDRFYNAVYKKTGKMPTTAEATEINRSIARMVNNQFGGQRWELIATLNNPRARQILDRAFAYPDWTMSALREVQDAFSANAVVRKGARGYLGRYVANIFTMSQMMNYASTGFYNKPDGSVGWSMRKARPTWKNEDPTKNWFAIQLPDIYIKWNGHKIPLGRDENGRHLYIHPGKKLFEIKGWLTDTVREGFNKSRPGVQAAIQQVTGYNISQQHAFPVQAGWTRMGGLQPWEGTKWGSSRNAFLRLKQLGENVLPFAVAGWTQYGVGPYISSGLGTLPISKGASEYSMEDHLLDAARKKDWKRYETYKNVLREQHYTGTSIARLDSKVRHKVREEEEILRKHK